MKTYEGGCHCRAVRFEVELAPTLEVEDCNCSICAMSGNMHVIVPESRFRLVKGQGALRAYRFNSKAAKHLFCTICGVKSFYIPRSNPDGIAVTYRCLDDWRGLNILIRPFDGVHWQANAARVAHKSKVL